jgi:hypothetical protein
MTKRSDGRGLRDRPEAATSRSSLLVAALAAVGLSACDPIVVLRGSVTVPPALQRGFSSEHRGRLVVVARHEGGGFPQLSWATLCEPSDTALVVPFHFQKVGCAQETRVEARLERVPESDPSELPACGSNGQSVRTREDALVASVAKTVLAGKTGCDDANVVVDLELPSR